MESSPSWIKQRNVKTEKCRQYTIGYRPVNVRRVRWVSIFWVRPWVSGHVLMMVWRGWEVSCTSITGIVTVAGKYLGFENYFLWRMNFLPRIVCGIGCIYCAVTSWTVHFQFAILALLGDGMHFGEENCRQKDTTWKNSSLFLKIIFFSHFYAGIRKLLQRNCCYNCYLR